MDTVNLPTVTTHYLTSQHLPPAILIVQMVNLIGEMVCDWILLLIQSGIVTYLKENHNGTVIL